MHTSVHTSSNFTNKIAKHNKSKLQELNGFFKFVGPAIWNFVCQKMAADGIRGGIV